jgi:hypothetical protein
MANGVGATNTIQKFLGTLPGNRKTRHRQELADITLQNTEIVDDILKLYRKLAKKRQYTDAEQLLKIARKVLDNNGRLQDEVGEVLADIK